MSFLKNFSFGGLLCVLAACVTTTDAKYGNQQFSYLQSKGIAQDIGSSASLLPAGGVKKGAKEATKPAPAVSDYQSRQVFQTLCSNPAFGKKMVANISLVIPNMPSGIPLQRAQSLRARVKTAAEKSVANFFSNEFYYNRQSFESQNRPYMRMAHIPDVGVTEISEDFKYHAAYFQTPIYFYIPKDDIYLLTFSSSYVDESKGLLCSPNLVKYDDRPSTYLFVPTGESKIIEARRAYLWEKPADLKLEPSDEIPKMSYKIVDPNGYNKPENWIESENRKQSEATKMTLMTYRPGDIAEIRILRENFVIVPNGMSDTTKILAQKDKIWADYIKQYTDVVAAESSDASVTNFMVTLDLDQMCQRGRHVSDLLSK